jgi:two-component system nitrogen regulation response regulator NtrX
MGNGEAEFQGDALEILGAYPWPGNIRELRNLAERIAVMYPAGKIDGKALGGLLQNSGGRSLGKSPGKSPDPVAGSSPGVQSAFSSNIMDKTYNEAKESFERYYLEFHLSRNNGIISRTAEAIGIYPSNLHSKLRKYHIAVNPVNGHGERDGG